MCGVVAISTAREEVSPTCLLKATQILNHRGPDSQTIWISNDRHIGLGHARLSVIDLYSGVQPLHSLNNHIHAVVNGEIYDYESISTFLTQKGHVFLTKSDSELIIHLYQEYGRECLSYLNGEFAFVIWDEEKNIIFAARDRFGIKPLYYSLYKENLYIASEIKSILALGVPPVWNYEAFLSIVGGVPSQYLSCFKEIYQVKPGHWIEVKRSQNQVVQHQYWDFTFPDKTLHSATNEQEYIEEFSRLFKLSVKRRLYADVPIACYLSGGIDSSSVLAMIAEEYQHPLVSFNISFVESEEHNEHEIAREMANSVGAEFHTVPVTLQDIADNYQKAIWHRESCVYGGNSIAKYLLSREVHKCGYKIVLTGEGADEILAGYPSLRDDCISFGMLENASQPYESNKKSKRKDHTLLHNRLDTRVSIESSENYPYINIKERLGFYPAWFRRHCHHGSKLKLLLSQEFTSKYMNNDPVVQFLDTVNINLQINPANLSLYLWSKTFLAEEILTSLGDRMEMSHSVEGRLPFLDIDLVNFATKIPIHLKSNKKTEKYILKESMKNKVLQKVLQREKHSLAIPPSVNNNTSTPLHHLMENVFSGDLLKKISFINTGAVLDMLKNLPNRAGLDYKMTENLLHVFLSACFLTEEYEMSVS